MSPPTRDKMKHTGYEIIELANGSFIARKLFDTGFSMELGKFVTQDEAEAAIKRSVNPRRWSYNLDGTLFGQSHDK